MAGRFDECGAPGFTSTEQKVDNSFENLFRRAENGRIIIGARQEGKVVEIFVRDFGKGIDPRYHQSIFDRYFRVPGTKVQVAASDWLSARTSSKLMAEPSAWKAK